MQKFFTLLAITACSLSASTIYSTATSATDGATHSVSFSVQFFLSGCVTGVNPSCNLFIDIANNTPNPTADTQEISGLSFTLVQGSTTLTSAGAILSSSITNGAGGAVSVVNYSGGTFSTTSTNATPTNWQLLGTGFNLTDITGGSPSDLILGPGPYTNANNSIKGHTPSLEGNVQFEILGIAGLTTSTQISNITFGVGTSGTSITPPTLVCTGTCDGTITSLNVSTPEPFTFWMAGGALLALGSFRRRFSR